MLFQGHSRFAMRNAMKTVEDIVSVNLLHFPFCVGYNDVENNVDMRREIQVNRQYHSHPTQHTRSSKVILCYFPCIYFRLFHKTFLSYYFDTPISKGKISGKFENK